MKCAFPAMAEGAAKAATASAPARTAVIFLILMKTSFRAAGVLRLRSSVPRIASPLTQSNLPGPSAQCQRLGPALPRPCYLQPGVSVVCPGGWHLPTCGPELPFPPPLLPGPKAGSPSAGDAVIASADTDRTTASILRRMSLYLLAATPLEPHCLWCGPLCTRSAQANTPASG